jgi:hypothetical protein
LPNLPTVRVFVTYYKQHISPLSSASVEMTNLFNDANFIAHLKRP